jgi:hypothetical protein
MPLTTITVLKATEFLTSTITEKFRGLIIERWTRYRAERFFRGFVEALGLELKSGVQTDELDNLLTKILTDDTKSEVLFDAYRRVCFPRWTKSICVLYCCQMVKRCIMRFSTVRSRYESEIL